METLYVTGIRRAEAHKLDLYDIDTAAQRLTVRLGKGQRDRIVPLTETAAHWLTRYLTGARPELAAGLWWGKGRRRTRDRANQGRAYHGEHRKNSYSNPLRFVDPDGHEPTPDPEPQDPCSCTLTPKQLAELKRDLERLDEATSKPLLPITDIIGTSTPPTIGPVPLPKDETVAPVPKVQQPLPPPPPAQAHKKKKQSTGKNKDHKKRQGTPGKA